MTMHWLSQQLGQLVKHAKQVNTKENGNHEGYEFQTAETHPKIELIATERPNKSDATNVVSSSAANGAQSQYNILVLYLAHGCQLPSD